MNTIRTLAISMAFAAAAATNAMAAGPKRNCAIEMKKVEKLWQNATPEGQRQEQAWRDGVTLAKDAQENGKYRKCVKILRKIKKNMRETR